VRKNAGKPQSRWSAAGTPEYKANALPVDLWQLGENGDIVEFYSESDYQEAS